jgi:hypothetical protein
MKIPILDDYHDTLAAAPVAAGPVPVRIKSRRVHECFYSERMSSYFFAVFLENSEQR